MVIGAQPWREIKMMENILLIPIGAVDSGILDSTAGALREIFGCEAMSGKSQPVPPETYDARRRQYASHRILKILEPLKPDRHTILLGVIDLDLYVPQLNLSSGRRIRRRVSRSSPCPSSAGVLWPQTRQGDFPPARGKRGDPRTGASPGPRPLPRSRMRHAFLEQSQGHGCERGAFLCRMQGKPHETGIMTDSEWRFRNQTILQVVEFQPMSPPRTTAMFSTRPVPADWRRSWSAGRWRRRYKQSRLSALRPCAPAAG